jgi:hypothetical protein
MTDPRAERQDAPLTDEELDELYAWLRWTNVSRLIRELREAQSKLENRGGDPYRYETYGEFSIAFPELAALIQPHEWDNKTLSDQMQWLAKGWREARAALDALGRDRDRVLGELVAVRAQAYANAKDRQLIFRAGYRIGRKDGVAAEWEAEGAPKEHDHFKIDDDQLVREAIDAAIAQGEPNPT